ncbi:MAG TPA: response regulator [Candidatus Acidoferrales bacterium]|jgi:two-component system response regulator FixJ|nr:response regulator [Candidatus Acidoferrales bacterium]
MRPANGAVTIAVVDDDGAVQNSICRLVQSVGYQCEVYGSAEAFLDALALIQPASAIIDFILPGLNGLELQRLLNERGAKMPIIMVSADGGRVRERALEQGAVAVLEKPFEAEALLAAIRFALQLSGS